MRDRVRPVEPEILRPRYRSDQHDRVQASPGDEERQRRARPRVHDARPAEDRITANEAKTTICSVLALPVT